MTRRQLSLRDKVPNSRLVLENPLDMVLAMELRLEPEQKVTMEMQTLEEAKRLILPPSDLATAAEQVIGLSIERGPGLLLGM